LPAEGEVQDFEARLWTDDTGGGPEPVQADLDIKPVVIDMTRTGYGDDEEHGIECLGSKAKDGGSKSAPIMVF
jgi:hypothetical protein